MPVERSYEEWLDRVKERGGWLGLREVPEELKDPEMCRIAVLRINSALKYVPEKFKTQEICNIAMLGGENAEIFRKLRRIKQGKRYVYESIIDDVYAVFPYIPERYRTLKMCRMAVEQDGSMLEFVPEQYKTPELCLMALKDHGDYLEFIPEKYKTPELCLAAVRKSGEGLKSVPEHLKTERLCRIAVICGGAKAIPFVPEQFLPRLCLKAAQMHRDSLEYIPEKSLTEEMCRAVVLIDGLCLKDIPESFKTVEMCALALTNVYQTDRNKLMSFVPKNIRANVRKAVGY
jgi:hypothetical protein